MTKIDEVAHLEKLLEDELKCQSDHSAAHGLPCGSTCSKNVIARKQAECDGKDFPICLNSYVWNVERLHFENSRCAGCNRHPSECWTITLI